MRLLARLPSLSLFGWWYWFRHGDAHDFQDSRGIPGPHDDDFFRRPIAESFRYRRRAVQRDVVRAPVGRKRRRVHGFGQRSVVRHLLQNVEVDDADVW